MKPEEKKERSDHAVVTFGRANPPHAGHIKLFKEIKKHAESAGADHHVFLSQSHDAHTNPLSHAQKVGFINKMAPDINVHKGSDVKNPLDMMHHLHKQGYKKVTVVVGSDRAQHFHNLLNQYNGKEGGYKFDKIHVKGINRDPDSKGVAGASATKMREHAKSGNFKEFRKHYPKEIAKEVFMATKKGLKENTALFLLGGPGSGKDILLRETALGSEVMELGLARLHDACVNQKDIVEVDGRPLIVNGNADDAEKVLLTKKVLEAVGYKTAMVFVAVSDSQSKSLNESRDRPINESIRSKKHAQSMRNLQLFKEQFASWNIFHNNVDQPDLKATEGFVALFFTGNLLDEEAKKFIDQQLDESWGHKVSSFAKFKEHAQDHADTNSNIGGVKFETREVGHHIGGSVKPWHQTSAVLTYHHNQHQPYIIGTFNHAKGAGSEEGHGQTLGYGKTMHEGAERSEFSAHRALQDTAKQQAKERAAKQQQRTHAGSDYFSHVHDSQVGKHSQLAKKDKSPQIRSVPHPNKGVTTEEINEERSTWKKNQVKKQRTAPGSKGDAAPATRFDSRVTDGMAMTATLAADSVQVDGSPLTESDPDQMVDVSKLNVPTKGHDFNTCRACRHLIKSGKTAGAALRHYSRFPHIHLSYSTNTKGKTIRELREAILPKSPEVFEEPERVYEDWGAEIKEVAGIKLNAPFKTSVGYAVIVEGDGELKTIDFQKITGTKADWETNHE